MNNEQPFSQLTPAQVERLAILAEECGEVIQIVGKILRHGYDSHHPTYKTELNNRDHLEMEIGNIDCAVQMLSDAGEVELSRIDRNAAAKLFSIKQYTHHQ